MSRVYWSVVDSGLTIHTRGQINTIALVLLLLCGLAMFSYVKSGKRQNLATCSSVLISCIAIQSVNFEHVVNFDTRVPLLKRLLFGGPDIGHNGNAWAARIPFIFEATEGSVVDSNGTVVEHFHIPAMRGPGSYILYDSWQARLVNRISSSEEAFRFYQWWLSVRGREAFERAWWITILDLSCLFSIWATRRVIVSIGYAHELRADDDTQPVMGDVIIYSGLGRADGAALVSSAVEDFERRYRFNSATASRGYIWDAVKIVFLLRGQALLLRWRWLRRFVPWR